MPWGRLRLGRRAKVFTGLLVTVALLAAALGLRAILTDDPDTREVGANGARFMVGDIEVHIPAGAVPKGTAFAATQVSAAPPRSVGGIDSFEAIGPGVDLRFEGGLQPKKPIEVSFPGPEDPSAVALVLQHEGEEPEFVQADHQPGRVSGAVPHLSRIWPVKFDAQKIVRGATEWLLQTLGIEQPEPSCTKDQPTIAGVRYLVAQPAEAWLCVADRDGKLEVKVSSNSIQPFIVTTKPTATSATPTTSLDITTALFAVIANGMQGSGRSVVANDVSTTLVFDPRPDEDVTLAFAQSPDLLYGQILLAAASRISGGFGSKALARLEGLNCLGSVVDVTRTNLSVGRAVALTRAFFDCLGPLLGELPWAHRVAITAVFGVPQLFVGSVLGLMREVTGRSRFEVTITALGSAMSRRLVKYDPPIVITSEADVSRLEGTPDGFKSFIADELERRRGEFTFDGCDRGAQLTIMRFRTDGFAAGTVGPAPSARCSSVGGGYATIYALTPSGWAEVWAGQSIPACGDTTNYPKVYVPKEFLAGCIGAGGDTRPFPSSGDGGRPQ